MLGAETSFRRADALEEIDERLRERLVVLVAAVTVVAVPATASAKSKNVATIVGSWDNTTMFKKNAPPSVKNGKEYSMRAFLSDGVVLEYATGTKTTGFGHWKWINRKKRTFTFTFHEFVFAGDNLLGYVQVHQTGTVSKDGKSYTANGGGQLHTPDGAVGPIPASDTTSTGKRITTQ